MISTSAPAQDPGAAISARGTPRKVTSGPYIPPSRGPILPAPPPRAPLLPAPPPRAPLLPAPSRLPRSVAEAPSMPRRGRGLSGGREPVHERAVGGVGEAEAGIRQVV